VIVATKTSEQSVRLLARQLWAWVAAMLVLVATVLSATWTVSMHALNIGQGLEEHISLGLRLHLLFRNEPLWTLQAIAAFPLRNEPTRMPVYACYLVIFTGMAYLGFRAARRLHRRWITVAIVMAIVMASAVPFVIGLNPRSFPGLWQGRYGLPYSVGIAVLIGFALDTAGAKLTTPIRTAALLLFVTAQAIGPVDVLLKSSRHRLGDYPDFPHLPATVIALTAAIGAALLWWGASHSTRTERGPATTDATVEQWPDRPT
jgi:hypothetical protein